MITRHFAKGDAASHAVYSDDLVYRYELTRRWGAGPAALFLMLNPSTATEEKNDPTIERCERRARDWGFAALSIGNLFAFRATYPKDLKAAADPVGQDNDAVLRRLADEAGLILCAWGVHGRLQGRDRAVADQLSGRDLHHLGLTKDGIPRHPLYLSYDCRPQAWTAP